MLGWLNRIFWVGLVSLVLGLLVTLARAEDAAPLRGIALVIGQADYQHLPKLTNTTNDARQVETLLNDLGFQTDVATDFSLTYFLKLTSRTLWH
jgi:hypothetical protein